MACGRVIDRGTKEPAKNRAAAYLNRGQLRLMMRDNDEAIKDFGQAIELDPKNWEAYFGRGKARAAKGEQPHISYDSAEALSDFDRAIALNSKETTLFIERATLLVGRRDFDRAFQDLEKALRLNPQNADVYSARGWAFYQKSEVGRALEAIDRAISLNPWHANAFLNRAMVNSFRGDRDLALLDIERTISLDPTHALAHHWRGSLLANGGHLDQAISALNEASRLDPKSPQTFALRGDALLLKGQYQAALADLGVAISLNPQLVEPYYTRARVFVAMNDPDKAIRDYTAVIQRELRFAQAYNDRGLALQTKGDHERAAADFSEAIRLEPRLAEAYYNRGVSLLETTDYDGAIDSFNTAISTGASTAHVLAKRGDVYASKKDFAAAIDDFTAVIKLEPRSSYAHRRRGEMRILIEQYRPALKDLAEAISLDPGDVEAHVTRAHAYEGWADYEAALASIEVAVQMRPNTPRLLNFRSHLNRLNNRLDQAIQDAEDAIRLEPRSGSAYANRGEAHRQKGNIDRAIIDLSEALRLEPHLTSTFAFRGLAFEAKGDLERARSDFQAAVRNPQARSQSANSALQTARERLLALGVLPDIQSDKKPLGTALERAHSAERGPRVALVIGNSNYRSVPAVTNPVNDARAVASALRDLHFNVIEGHDLDANAMRNKLSEFGKAIVGAGVTLLFYAGHGIQVGGKNFILPIDVRLERPSSLAVETIELGAVLSDMESEKRTNIIILDACRDNPFSQTVAQSRNIAPQKGLAVLHAGVGTLITFATSPDAVAQDGQEVNSPFTAALVKHIRTPDLEVRTMMTRVRADVLDATNDQQVPWDHSSLIGDFYFGGPPVSAFEQNARRGDRRKSVSTKPIYFVGRDGTRWQAVEGDDKQHIINNLALMRGLTLSPEATVIAKKALTFFPGYDLVNVTTFESTQKNEDFYLFGKGDMLQLDGTNDPIYFVSEKASRITKENASEYVRFFFQYVLNPYGTFIVLNDRTDIVWPQNPNEALVKKVEDNIHPVTIARESGNTLELYAVVLFRGLLFRTKVELTLEANDVDRKKGIIPGKIYIMDHEVVSDEAPISGFHAFSAKRKR